MDHWSTYTQGMLAGEECADGLVVRCDDEVTQKAHVVDGDREILALPVEVLDGLFEGAVVRDPEDEGWRLPWIHHADAR